jgi:O-antigen/teichoic acid export membrane protein
MLGVFAMRFVTGVIIGRNYGPKASGELTNVITFLFVIYILPSFGIKDAILKLIPQYREKYNIKAAWSVYVKSVHILLINWFIIIIPAWIYAEFQAQQWSVPYLADKFKIGLLLLPFILLSELNAFTLRAILRNKQANYANLLFMASRIIIISVMTLFFFNRYNPIYLHYISSMFCAWLFGQYYVIKFLYEPAKNEENLYVANYGEIFSLAWPMFITYLGFTISTNFDGFFLPYFVSTADVGIYKTCLNISSVAALALVAMNTTIQPKISQLYQKGNPEAIHSLCVKFTRMVFLVTIPGFILVLFFSKFMIQITYGKEFVGGAVSLTIASIGQIFNVGCGPVAQLLNVTGHHKQFRNISLLGAAINIAAIIIAVPHLGIIGAALASTVSMATWNIVGTIYIKKKFGYYISLFPN